MAFNFGGGSSGQAGAGSGSPYSGGMPSPLGQQPADGQSGGFDIGQQTAAGQSGGFDFGQQTAGGQFGGFDFGQQTAGGQNGGFDFGQQTAGGQSGGFVRNMENGGTPSLPGPTGSTQAVANVVKPKPIRRVRPPISLPSSLWKWLLIVAAVVVAIILMVNYREVITDFLVQLLSWIIILFVCFLILRLLVKKLFR